MSTHWFHDHMFGFTSQNVYKGNAGMFNIYSALDRGTKDINDGVNLRLPSGIGQVVGQPRLRRQPDAGRQGLGRGRPALLRHLRGRRVPGRQITVNSPTSPTSRWERRKYRFRILNGSVARFFKIALSDGSPMIQIANDGNLLRVQ